MSVNVSALLSGTSTKKHFPDSLSIPPKTQCPSRHCPLWYLRWKNLDSSISTVFETIFSSRPPSIVGWSIKNCSQTSRQNEYQSTIVWVEVSGICASKAVFSWLKSLDHPYIMVKICSRERWLLEKNESALTLAAARHCLHFHWYPSPRWFLRTKDIGIWHARQRYLFRIKCRLASHCKHSIVVWNPKPRSVTISMRIWWCSNNSASSTIQSGPGIRLAAIASLISLQ